MISGQGAYASLIGVRYDKGPLQPLGFPFQEGAKPRGLQCLLLRGKP